jgi:hypothetical protein
MRELYIEGVAIHGGPESCVGVREGVGEALAGVHVGRAIEPGNAPSSTRRSHVAGGPRRVEEPVHAWNLHAREPGGPVLARSADHPAGRSGKAKAARLR